MILLNTYQQNINKEKTTAVIFHQVIQQKIKRDVFILVLRDLQNFIGPLMGKIRGF